MSQFERRFILFLDFLGFKSIVEGTEQDPDKLNNLLAAMNVLKELGSGRSNYSTQVSTQFSDCVVISCVVDEESAVFWLVNDIAIALIELVELGYLARGALTSGSLLHDEEFLLGSAMNEAYRLESKVAKYPRVIVDESIMEIVANAKQKYHSVEEEQGYVDAFLAQDSDGYKFLDYISFDGVVNAAGGVFEKFPGYLRRLAAIIESGLSNESSSVVEKFLWLHERYAKSIDGYIEHYSIDENYRRDPALAKEFLSLPKLQESAQIAKKRIQIGFWGRFWGVVKVKRKK